MAILAHWLICSGGGGGESSKVILLAETNRTRHPSHDSSQSTPATASPGTTALPQEQHPGDGPPRAEQESHKVLVVQEAGFNMEVSL